jgi:hypothetical protein
MYANGHPAAATTQADSHPMISGYDAKTVVSIALELAVKNAARKKAIKNLNHGFTGIAFEMTASGLLGQFYATAPPCVRTDVAQRLFPATTKAGREVVAGSASRQTK